MYSDMQTTVGCCIYNYRRVWILYFFDGEKMNNKLVLISSFVLLSLASAFGQMQRDTGDIFSPYNARPLQSIVDDLYLSARSDLNKARQAMILLEAVNKLDPRADSLLEDTIRFAVLFPDNEYSELLNASFAEYLDDDSDLEVLRSIVSYGLSQLNSREQRQEYLLAMLQKTGNRNSAFASEVATQLALLDLETGDAEAAKTRLITAHDLFAYNEQAYLKMDQLFAASDLTIPAPIYASQLRRRMVLNPAGIGTALSFADFAQQVRLYDVACDAYEYAWNLYAFLYPDDDIPASIYLPWAVCSYNTDHRRMKCFEIASMVRQSGRFDLILEGITARVASAVGDFNQKREVMLAGRKAEQILTSNPTDDSVTPEQIAWFYMFASPDFEKALAWANRAYSADPKSEQVKAILGYAFVLNGNYDLAKELIDGLEDKHQIAAIASAMIKLSESDKEGAVETLKKAVEMDPSTLAAERAVSKIEDLGSEYIPVLLPENTQKELKRYFGSEIVPQFTPLNRIVEIKLGVPGSELRYGNDLNATVTITNRSNQPLVISDDSFINGNVRIDAQVRGDINRYIPRLVEFKIRPSKPLETNRYALRDVNLSNTVLRKLLQGHPQAQVQIDFTVYIDPVVAKDGSVRNAMPFIKPEVRTVTRKKINILRESLITQLNYLSSGQVKQRVNGVELFTGLYMEYKESQQPAGLEYPAIPIELPLLTSALRKGLNDEDWTVRFHTMYQLLPVSGDLEFSFVRRISELLSSRYWPERMMALYLLSNSQGSGFQPVIDWVSENDNEKLVRQFADIIKNSPIQPAAAKPDTVDITDNPEARQMVEMLIEP